MNATPVMDPLFAKIIGCSAAAVACSVAYLAARYRVFRTVTWTSGPMEGFTYVYVDHVGPYKTVGKAFDKLLAEMKDAEMPVDFKYDRFVGVYLDNPGKVPASECRARAGVIVDDETAAACPLPSRTYQSQETAQTQLLYIDFLSVLIAISKAYPALQKYCKSRGDEEFEETIEMYDLSKRTVTFHAISKQ
eukprot:jgi/Ulvmu1/3871/UM018_0090.1